MKIRTTVALAIIAGFGLGAATVGVIHAQAKPPVFVVAEIDITNMDAYMKEYQPKAVALVQKHGGRLLAASANVDRASVRRRTIRDRSARYAVANRACASSFASGQRACVNSSSSGSFGDVLCLSFTSLALACTSPTSLAFARARNADSFARFARLSPAPARPQWC